MIRRPDPGNTERVIVCLHNGNELSVRHDNMFQSMI